MKAFIIIQYYVSFQHDELLMRVLQGGHGGCNLFHRSSNRIYLDGWVALVNDNITICCFFFTAYQYYFLNRKCRK